MYHGPMFTRIKGLEDVPNETRGRLMQRARVLAQYALDTMQRGNMAQFHTRRRVGIDDDLQGEIRVDVHSNPGLKAPVIITTIELAEVKKKERIVVRRLYPPLFLVASTYAVEANPDLNVSAGKLIAKIGTWRIFERPSYLEPGRYFGGWATQESEGSTDSSYAASFREAPDGSYYVCGYGALDIAPAPAELTTFDSRTNAFYCAGTLVVLNSSDSWTLVDGSFALSGEGVKYLYSASYEVGLNKYGTEAHWWNDEVLVFNAGEGSFSVTVEELDPIETWRDRSPNENSDNCPVIWPNDIELNPSYSSHQELYNLINFSRGNSICQTTSGAVGQCPTIQLCAYGATTTIGARAFTVKYPSDGAYNYAYVFFPWGRDCRTPKFEGWESSGESNTTINFPAITLTSVLNSSDPIAAAFCAGANFRVYQTLTVGEGIGTVNTTDNRQSLNWYRIGDVSVDWGPIANIEATCTGVSPSQTINYSDVASSNGWADTEHDLPLITPYFTSCSTTTTGGGTYSNVYKSIQFGPTMGRVYLVREQTTNTIYQGIEGSGDFRCVSSSAAGFGCVFSTQISSFDVHSLYVNTIEVPSALVAKYSGAKPLYLNLITPVTADLCFLFSVETDDEYEIWGVYEENVTELTGAFSNLDALSGHSSDKFYEFLTTPGSIALRGLAEYPGKAIKLEPETVG